MRRDPWRLDDFWRAFAAERWELSPAVLPSPLPEPLTSGSQALELAVQASTCWRRGQGASLRFFLENALVQSNLDEYLPVGEDESFSAYARRIAPSLGGQGFALVVNRFAQYDFSLFGRARRFLRGLYERVGMPADYTDMDLFVGNYRHTPFGVHTDLASNFCFVLEGRKRFLLWPGPALRERREVHGSVSLATVRELALVLEAEAGQVVYWPSSYWHIAEGEGDLSVALNVALYLGDTTGDFVARAVRAPKPAPSGPATLPWPAGERGRGAEAARLPSWLPGALQEPFAEAARPFASCASPLRAVQEAWLSRVSAYNFHRSVPPARPAPVLAPGARVRVQEDFPIVVQPAANALLCAAHGHVLEVPDLPAVRALAGWLNEGGSVSAEQLAARVAERFEGDGVGLREVVALLEALLSIRALEVAA